MPTIQSVHEPPGPGCCLLSLVALAVCVAISPWLFLMLVATMAMFTMTD